MSRLNGWQRLWVVGTIGWGFLVVVVATLLWSPPQLGEEGGLPPPAPRRPMFQEPNSERPENQSPSTVRVGVPAELIGGRDGIVAVEVAAN